MKKAILVTAVLIGIALSFAYNAQPDFDSIWKKGYIDGWCYEQDGYCLEPNPPLAPLPRLRDTTYTIIYNRGFLTGLRAYKKSK